MHCPLRSRPTQCFDQFARILVKAHTTRPDQVLDLLGWSSRTAIEALRDLPILGDDLFSWQFVAKLQEEAERLKALREADEHMSRLGNPANQLLRQQGSGRNRWSRQPVVALSEIRAN